MINITNIKDETNADLSPDKIIVKIEIGIIRINNLFFFL